MYNHNKAQQKQKPCAYFLGYTVGWIQETLHLIQMGWGTESCEEAKKRGSVAGKTPYTKRQEAKQMKCLAETVPSLSWMVNMG